MESPKTLRPIWAAPAKLYSLALHPGLSTRTKGVTIHKLWQHKSHQAWIPLLARTIKLSSRRQDTSSCSQWFNNLRTSHRHSLKSSRPCLQLRLVATISNNSSLNCSLRLATFITCREAAALMLQCRVALHLLYLNTTSWMLQASLSQPSLGLRTSPSFRTLRWFLALAVDSSSNELGCAY